MQTSYMHSGSGNDFMSDAHSLNPFVVNGICEP